MPKLSLNLHKFWTVVFSIVMPMILTGQTHYERLTQMDVQHYAFRLKLNDENKNLEGSALVTIHFLDEIPSVVLDLVKKDASGKGMTVTAVSENEHQFRFEQQADKLFIHLPRTTKVGDVHTFQIDYQGIPADGLIMDQNKFGDKTFFGDNWPNRAHHWLPTVDHPADKASVEFIVTAPAHYQVIANGVQIEETNLESDLKLTHWAETMPLPTKVMVIGVAPFAVRLAGEPHGIPVTSWVFPENRLEGFYDYEQAVSVLDWFVTNVAPYPYKKLANVQSKTRYGGMENASNIFYFENSVTGGRERESLIAHEIAHQWFGNSASEANWHHVWLSEGFATYFTILYNESVHGADAAKKELLEDRQQVIAFTRRNFRPVVDTTITDYNQLLNTNSYQKGSWVLHMLRQEVGDSVFWKGARTYYDRYKFSNALTVDFQKVMEEISGKELQQFFRQWIFTAGHPQLEVIWDYDAKKQELLLHIQQMQQGTVFQFPLEVAITDDNGETRMKQLYIQQQDQNFIIKIESAPKSVRLDPEVKLLQENIVIKK